MVFTISDPDALTDVSRSIVLPENVHIIEPNGEMPIWNQIMILICFFIVLFIFGKSIVDGIRAFFIINNLMVGIVNDPRNHAKIEYLK
jgi:hypothetical protein